MLSYFHFNSVDIQSINRCISFKLRKISQFKIFTLILFKTHCILLILDLRICQLLFPIETLHVVLVKIVCLVLLFKRFTFHINLINMRDNRPHLQLIYYLMIHHPHLGMLIRLRKNLLSSFLPKSPNFNLVKALLNFPQNIPIKDNIYQILGTHS